MLDAPHEPIVETRLGAERLYDVHFKDVTEASPRGRSAPCGRGVIDLPQLIRTLCDIDYQGYLAFEYEEEPDDPLPGLAESVGCVHGVLDSLLKACQAGGHQRLVRPYRVKSGKGTIAPP